MDIGSLGGVANAYSYVNQIRFNQSTKVKNTSSSVFSKTMTTMTEVAAAYSREPVRESVVTRHTEYTDPETEKNVPVNIRYTTSYSEDGIMCQKSSDVGDKSSEKELWKLSFASAKEYEKVQDFLKKFSADDNLTFATQENFWKDFLQDDFNADDFQKYYDSTNNGLVDIEKAMSMGKTLRETLTEKNAEYLNNSHFVGRIYTEDDLQPSWYKHGEARINKVYDSSVPGVTTVSSESTLKKATKQGTTSMEDIIFDYKQNISRNFSDIWIHLYKMGYR